MNQKNKGMANKIGKGRLGTKTTRGNNLNIPYSSSAIPYTSFLLVKGKFKFKVHL